ncbi:MAG: aldo/keto reductase [Gammaproteobacteria bacterium]|nr:aldo/keto reductase [Gammaproteobacteria bacterium]
MLTIDRRLAIQMGLALAACGASAASPLIRKAIPKSGERLPVVGLGTNNYSPKTPEERAARREVIAGLTGGGASVIDTAPSYRESEQTLGELIGEIGNRRQIFLATKVTARGGTREEGIAMLDNSLRMLRAETLDLVQVHNLVGTAVLLPLLREQVAAKKIRYVGITTSQDAQYAEMTSIMKNEALDFIQIDYSLGNRGAGDELLPLAADRGMAVLINLPFGGRRDGNLFSRVRDQELPGWANDISAKSWGQLFLKYVISHPAVTCAIPGMTRLANLEDNLAAAQGTLPDAAMRRRMESWWDSLPG